MIVSQEGKSSRREREIRGGWGQNTHYQSNLKKKTRLNNTTHSHLWPFLRCCCVFRFGGHSRERSRPLLQPYLSDVALFQEGFRRTSTSRLTEGAAGTPEGSHGWVSNVKQQVWNDVKHISRKQATWNLPGWGFKWQTHGYNSSFPATHQLSAALLRWRFARCMDTRSVCVEISAPAVWIILRSHSWATENDEADDVLDCLHSGGRVIYPSRTQTSLHINETPAAWKCEQCGWRFLGELLQSHTRTHVSQAGNIWWHRWLQPPDTL